MDTYDYVMTKFGRQPGHELLRRKGQGAIRDCARAIDVTEMQLRLPLMGRTRPNINVRERLPEFLGVPLEECFTEEVLEK